MEKMDKYEEECLKSRDFIEDVKLKTGFMKEFLTLTYNEAVQDKKDCCRIDLDHLAALGEMLFEINSKARKL